MAIYTTANDIKKYYNGLNYTDSDGNPTNISEANVNQFISEQSVKIDMFIGRKHTLPITNASDLVYLKLICDNAVVCQIDKILRTFSTDEESDMVRNRNTCKEAKEMLDNIMNSSTPLLTAQKSLSGFRYNKTTVYSNTCKQI